MDGTCCTLTTRVRTHTQLCGSEVHKEGRYLGPVCWFMCVQCSRVAEWRPQTTELDCRGSLPARQLGQVTPSLPPHFTHL